MGRADFRYGGAAALVRSVKGKLFPLGDGLAFPGGHGPGSTFGVERRTNPSVGEEAR